MRVRIKLVELREPRRVRIRRNIHADHEDGLRQLLRTPARGELTPEHAPHRAGVLATVRPGGVRRSILGWSIIASGVGRCGGFVSELVDGEPLRSGVHTTAWVRIEQLV